MYDIYIISDGTGRTAVQSTEATLTQYPNAKVNIHIHSKVRTKKKIKKIIDEVKESKGFIVHTIVTDELRELITNSARKHNIEAIDLMGTLLARLSDHFSNSPTEKPGLFSQLNKEYFRRIESMEFALRHDDGLYVDELRKAEIVLIGVSRTFKTPVSIYLAFKGWFVANVPIYIGSKPPSILKKLPKGKVFCLDTNPRSLSALRFPRDNYLKGITGDYTDAEHIKIELMEARSFFRTKQNWPIINVANKPIEEIASEILSIRSTVIK
jgi:[pyruvate, water dikinase]-phosphate phosphotransferase / [pyruvate, water dikinase] kinase